MVPTSTLDQISEVSSQGDREPHQPNRHPNLAIAEPTFGPPNKKRNDVISTTVALTPVSIIQSVRSQQSQSIFADMNAQKWLSEIDEMKYSTPAGHIEDEEEEEQDYAQQNNSQSH